MLKRPLAGALDDRPIGERIAEGDAEFNHARTRIDGRPNYLTCRGEVGVSTGHVCDQRWLVFEVERHKGIVDCRGQIAEVRSRPGGNAGGFSFRPVLSNL